MINKQTITGIIYVNSLLFNPDKFVFVCIVFKNEAATNILCFLLDQWAVF